MRVGILDYANDGLRSGVEYYTLGLIRCLAHHCEEDEIVVYTNDPATIAQVHPRVVIRSIPGRKCKAMRLWWQHLRLPRQAEADGLDVLHCPAYVMPLRRCRVPCVITVHDIHVLTLPQWCSLGNRLHYGLMLGRSLRKATAVIAVSEDTREAICRHFGALRDEIRVIPPGIDDIFCHTTGNAVDDECRQRHRLPNRFVLHVGNIEPRKNISAAIEAMRLLRNSGKDYVLVLAGRAIRAPIALLREIEQAQRDGIVQSLGYVARADLPSLYRLADAVLCVAHHEGFGIPGLEAMACGTPVISSMQGAMHNTHSHAAMAVGGHDARSIADVLASVIDDASLRDNMRRLSLQRAADFRWEAFILQLRETYIIASQAEKPHAGK